jgi:hypothetical protein|tara:strand:+ start:3608 stop:4618 length:1011 start_codon:yes stop_codon:yes gene_type:complete
MVQTNIEYFNYNLKLFVLDIIKIFPELEETLREYYAVVLTEDSSNEDKFIKRYMRKMTDYKQFISQKNNDIFNESIYVLKSVDFKDLWKRDEMKESIKNTIWDYMQTLFVIGETIVSDSNSIKKLVENFKKIRETNDETDTTSKTLTESSNESTPTDDGVDGDEEGKVDTSAEEVNNEVLEMLKSLSEKTTQNDAPELNEELINNGLIGNLAKELSEDINLDDFNLNMNEDNSNVGEVFSNLISGDNPMKFMNLIQNVGQKIQSKLSDGNIDQSKLVEEAQKMMGMLGNNNPLFDNLMNKTKEEMKEANPPSSASYNNSTRDRLRRKLEQRKNNKN